jgi:L-ascorbate metabolism protein UlaG (beta-lactamase superfamily)
VGYRDELPVALDSFRHPDSRHGSSSVNASSTPLYLGEPAGVVIHTEGKTIYHAGDTALFSDMRLIGEDAPIHLALLPIGDLFDALFP